MTWTYAGTPGTDTAAERRDAVRLYVGDTDTSDQGVTDEEIAFALSEANDSIYAASGLIARSLASKYARLVDTSIESVSVKYSQRREQYEKIASQMERLERKYGAGLGTPLAGGISIAEMDAADDDSDRPRPRFNRGDFENPSDSSERREDWYSYHR